MELGGFHTRFEGWGRRPAILVLALFAALIAFASWSPERAPAPKLRTSPAQHSDLQLYRDIIKDVHNGESYYVAAAREQRAANYPLKPFYTVRLPTHATVYATFGEPVMIGLVWALCAALIVAWWVRLKPVLPLPLLGASTVLMGGGLGGFLQPMTGLFHECWAALLMALMIAVRRPGTAWPAVIAGGAALMVRELALPMILTMAGLALMERRWREAAGWAAALTIFAGYMTLHAHWVAEVVLPQDRASPGWSGLLGIHFALKSLAKVTFGIQLPDAVAAVLLILSLAGWASVRAGWALRAFLLLFGYIAMLALFARADTFYWALIAAPLSFMGLVFLPKSATDLAKAVRRTPYP